MNEKYKFTIDKLVSIKEIIKNIEETNYIDGYLGYEDDFYIDSILYYLKENARLKDKIEKAIEYINEFEDIKAYYSYEENGYEEYNYDEDFKIDLLEILKGGD